MSTHARQQRTITAENQFTARITVTNAVATLLVMATAMTATIVLQVRPDTDTDASGADVAWADDDTGWQDRESPLTAAGMITTLQLGGSWQVRAGCKTGAFTSATALRIFLRTSQA